MCPPIVSPRKIGGVNEKPLTTRQKLTRVAPHLYRHDDTEEFYGICKVGKKRKTTCLKTADRKTADRKLRQWMDDLANADITAADVTLEALLTKFQAARVGKAGNTKATELGIISAFRARFPRPMTTFVSRVRHSDLVEWLGIEAPRLRHSSYNRYRFFLRQLFDLAVSDRIIARSPFDEGLIRTKKKQKIERPIPTEEEFQRIIQSIRENKHNAERHDSADFAEFLGLAGVGQAEAAHLQWPQVEETKIHFIRKKTGLSFYIPMYPWLKPLMDRLRAAAGEDPIGRVFKVRDVKGALEGALERLKLRHFSHRSLRAMLIGKLWKAGVDVKLISKWQGHHDGGKLIMDTYTEVFGSNDESYEAAQLAKVSGSIVSMIDAA